MKERMHISSGAPWERLAGYSRAVRAGPIVSVSGTTAVDAEGKVVGVGDPYRQAQRALEIIVEGLRQCGAGAPDVIRTRMYVTDIGHWQEVARAHAEVFGDVRPATSMVEVSRLIDPDMLVEIEADAVVAETAPVPEDES